MNSRAALWVMMLSGSLSSSPAWGQRPASPATLPAPHFHHIHLNSTNPEAAIDYYTKRFPSTSRATWAGFPALKTGNVYLLFTRVGRQVPVKPQSAFWHFGWHVMDVRERNITYIQAHIPLLPLYTGDADAFVYISSDTWPGTAGTLGRTKAEIGEAKADGIKPRGGPGFAYLAGPDHAIIEYSGNYPSERLDHIHMYQDDPFCAQLWYVEHLNAKPNYPTELHTPANCKVPRGPDKSWPALVKDGMYRVPRAGVLFDQVALNWYANPGTRPLAGSRGQVYDHIALSVSSLNPWITKLKAEKVKFLIKHPYMLGESRAIMIEGPSREAIELVEVKE